MLRVKVIANAGRVRIDGVRAGELVVRLSAAPEKGRANQELLKLLASELSLSRSALQIVSGRTARHKLLRLPAEAAGGLEALLRTRA